MDETYLDELYQDFLDGGGKLDFEEWLQAYYDDFCEDDPDEG